MKRNRLDRIAVAKAAVLAVAEIKSATDAFDRGETNVREALDAIEVIIHAYRCAAEPDRVAA